MANNTNLRKASLQKNDEFYTRLVDIEKELKHYKDHFKGKIVFCNCDDPFESNFFKYFSLNFNFLGLKKLIATCYDSSPIAYTQLSLFDGGDKTVLNNNRRAYKIEICEVEDYNGDGAVDLSDVEYLLKNKKNTLTLLKEDGDFRSEECVQLLKQADIVVTNPPFSLFREYIIQLVEYKKHFILIGNKNAITYKELFPLLRDNEVWIGYEQPSKFLDGRGNITNQVQGLCRWFTNLDINKRHEDLILYKNYVPEEYPFYENYRAININKVSDIPFDYYETMGVPITFLDSYNPNQFEIIGFGSGYLGQSIGITGIPKEHKQKMKGHSAAGDLYYMDGDKPKVPYGRILIRRKKNED